MQRLALRRYWSSKDKGLEGSSARAKTELKKQQASTPTPPLGDASSCEPSPAPSPRLRRTGQESSDVFTAQHRWLEETLSAAENPGHASMGGAEKDASPLSPSRARSTLARSPPPPAWGNPPEPPVRASALKIELSDARQEIVELRRRIEAMQDEAKYSEAAAVKAAVAAAERVATSAAERAAALHHGDTAAQQGNGRDGMHSLIVAMESRMAMEREKADEMLRAARATLEQVQLVQQQQAATATPRRSSPLAEPVSWHSAGFKVPRAVPTAPAGATPPQARSRGSWLSPLKRYLAESAEETTALPQLEPCLLQSEALNSTGEVTRDSATGGGMSAEPAEGGQLPSPPRPPPSLLKQITSGIELRKVGTSSASPLRPSAPLLDDDSAARRARSKSVPPGLAMGGVMASVAAAIMARRRSIATGSPALSSDSESDSGFGSDTGDGSESTLSSFDGEVAKASGANRRHRRLSPRLLTRRQKSPATAGIKCASQRVAHGAATKGDERPWRPLTRPRHRLTDAPPTTWEVSPLPIRHFTPTPPSTSETTPNIRRPPAPTPEQRASTVRHLRQRFAPSFAPAAFMAPRAVKPEKSTPKMAASEVAAQAAPATREMAAQATAVEAVSECSSEAVNSNGADLLPPLPPRVAGPRRRRPTRASAGWCRSAGDSDRVLGVAGWRRSWPLALLLVMALTSLIQPSTRALTTDQVASLDLIKEGAARNGQAGPEDAMPEREVSYCNESWLCRRARAVRGSIGSSTSKATTGGSAKDGLLELYTVVEQW